MNKAISRIVMLLAAVVTLGMSPGVIKPHIYCGLHVCKTCHHPRCF